MTRQTTNRLQAATRLKEKLAVLLEPSPLHPSVAVHAIYELQRDAEQLCDMLATEESET